MKWIKRLWPFVTKAQLAKERKQTTEDIKYALRQFKHAYLYAIFPNTLYRYDVPCHDMRVPYNGIPVARAVEALARELCPDLVMVEEPPSTAINFYLEKQRKKTTKKKGK